MTPSFFWSSFVTRSSIYYFQILFPCWMTWFFLLRLFTGNENRCTGSDSWTCSCQILLSIPVLGLTPRNFYFSPLLNLRRASKIIWPRLFTSLLFLIPKKRKKKFYPTPSSSKHIFTLVWSFLLYVPLHSLLSFIVPSLRELTRSPYFKSRVPLPDCNLIFTHINKKCPLF